MLIFWGGGNAAALFFEVFDVPNKKKHYLCSLFFDQKTIFVKINLRTINYKFL